jgi:hypothetical protein
MEMFVLGVIFGLAIAALATKLIVGAAVNRVQQELGPDFDRVIDRMAKELEEQEDLESGQVGVTLERHNDSFLVYHNETSQFLAQGPDYWSVIEKLETMYPENTTFKIMAGETQAVRDFITSSDLPRPV